MVSPDISPVDMCGVVMAGCAWVEYVIGEMVHGANCPHSAEGKPIVQNRPAKKLDIILTGIV